MRPRPLAAAIAALTVGATALVGVVATTPSDEAVTPVADNPVTFMGAGDIASCGSSTLANATATGDLIREANPDKVFALGDNAYNDGSLSQYQNCYDPTWGSFKAKTYPVPGNHEDHTSNMQGYRDYYGNALVSHDGSNSGDLYYAKDLGNGWRAYFLNYYEDSAGMDAQQAWLEADLAANADKHIIAAFHRPRYNIGDHGWSTGPCDFWNALQQYGADLILTGHDHTYQRYAKMDCDENTNSSGIRQFVVGGGGNQLYPWGSDTGVPVPQSQDNDNYGVLKLTLHANSYDWQYIASGRGWNGSTSIDTGNKGQILDSGSAATNLTLDTGGTDPTPTPTDTATPTPTDTQTPTPTDTASPTPTDTTSPTPTTPPAGGTLHYANNPQGDYQELADLGYNLFDTGMSSTVNSLPAGGKALVWVPDGDCLPTTPSQAFRDFVDANADNPNVWGYYLADEPQSTSQSCIDGMKAYADYIHAANPDQKALVLLTDYPGTYAAYSPQSAHVDLVGIDPYPCRWDIGTSGGCDYTMIEDEIAAVQAAGIPLSQVVPMFQVFGDTPDGTWKPPTTSELQMILTEWQEYLPDPVIDMSYTWGINYANQVDVLSNRTDWQQVMADYISGMDGGSTVTPTPTDTTSPTPTDTASPTPTDTASPTPTETPTTPPPDPTNTAPVVDAGDDMAFDLPASGTIQFSTDATVTDDGLPAGSTVTTSWSIVSGPDGGIVYVGTPSGAPEDRTYEVSKAGTYVLEVTASDGELTSTDQVTVTVDPPASVDPTVVTSAWFTGVGSNQVTALVPSEAQPGDVLLVGVEEVDGRNAAITCTADLESLGAEFDDGSSLGLQLFRYDVPETGAASSFTCNAPSAVVAASVTVLRDATMVEWADSVAEGTTETDHSISGATSGVDALHLVVGSEHQYNSGGAACSTWTLDSDLTETSDRCVVSGKHSLSQAVGITGGKVPAGAYSYTATASQPSSYAITTLVRVY